LRFASYPTTQPRRRRLPKDEGYRQIATMPLNAEGWLYVSAVDDLFSRRVVVGYRRRMRPRCASVAERVPDDDDVRPGHFAFEPIKQSLSIILRVIIVGIRDDYAET
jgi:hypothetical protein